MRYTFKDIYTDRNGSNVEKLYTTRFYSPIAIGTSGTRSNPALSKTISITTSNQSLIFGGGTSVSNITIGERYTARIIGNGLGISFLSFVINSEWFNYNATDFVYFKDISINEGTNVANGYVGSNINHRYDNCEMLSIPTKTGNCIVNNYYNRCIFRVPPTSTTTTNTIYANNTFINSSALIPVNMNQCLYENTDITLTVSNLSTLTNTYIAFDNCRFRIGLESNYTELIGTTPSELRNDFVARCLAQGFDAPENTEYGETLKFYRWIFTKNSSTEGYIPKNSDIHNFEFPRSLSFGANSTRIEKISVTTSSIIPKSISPAFPNSNNLLYTDGFLSKVSEIDITDHHNFFANSNIIWLDGRRRLTDLAIVNNFPQKYGLQVDSTYDLLLDKPILPGGIIETGKFYILRSTDKQIATISYNGVTYSTSLVTGNRNHVIYGVSAATTYSQTSGNPVLYEVYDELQYSTIKMRIVNKIPIDIIKTGSLLVGYWYLVEHDTDQNNTTDYILYNGQRYPATSSFIVLSGVTNFTVTGNIHLRRCWKEEFSLDTETVDRAFWQNEQKPKWFDVIKTDIRCLLKNNNEKSIEMETDDDGNYIASGHPLFYKNINGEGGFFLQPMPITGTYIQVKIIASTLNPM